MGRKVNQEQLEHLDLMLLAPQVGLVVVEAELDLRVYNGETEEEFLHFIQLFFSPIYIFVEISPDRQLTEEALSTDLRPDLPRADLLLHHAIARVEPQPGGGEVCLGPGGDGQVGQLAQGGQGLSSEPVSSEAAEVCHFSGKIRLGL